MIELGLMVEICMLIGLGQLVVKVLYYPGRALFIL